MWSPLKSNPQLNNLEVPMNSINPETPSFGQHPYQFTFNGLDPLMNKTTQQSNLLEDSSGQEQTEASSKRGKERGSSTDIRTPLKQKKNFQVTSSWSKQEIINELILEKKTLGMKLERSEEENRRLTSRLESKCKEFETIKVELLTLKQSLMVQSQRSVVKEQTPRTDLPYHREAVRSSSSVFQSKRSSSDFQREEHPLPVYNHRENFSHEKMFKDRLERVCKRLEVLEQQQHLIRYKNKINPSPSRTPYR